MKTTINKAIIFDSSTLINFTINGLLDEFRDLKKMFGGRFLITNEIKEEIINKPLSIKRYKLEALKIKQLLDEKIIETPYELGIDAKAISKMTENIIHTANNTFFSHENPIQIVHLGEASCIALSAILNEQKIENVVAADERTIRMLGEKPENLADLLQKKLHTGIKDNKDNFKFFKGFKFIRSTELIYVAYKKGLVTIGNHDALDALLYALKFNGCSISDEEISEIEKL